MGNLCDCGVCEEPHGNCWVTGAAPNRLWFQLSFSLTKTWEFCTQCQNFHLRSLELFLYTYRPALPKKLSIMLTSLSRTSAVKPPSVLPKQGFSEGPLDGSLWLCFPILMAIPPQLDVGPAESIYPVPAPSSGTQHLQEGRNLKTGFVMTEISRSCSRCCWWEAILFQPNLLQLGWEDAQRIS